MTTETEAKPKPDYLGLLNAISLAESRAGLYLKAWAEVTADPELRRCLNLVAERETTHGHVFRQRIERLGFTLRDREDPTFNEKLRVYGSPARPDLEKIRYGRSEERAEGGADPLIAIEERARDESVDPLTRATLQWYVCEERDSGALLREAYARVEGQEASGANARETNGASAKSSTPEIDAVMQALSEGFGSMLKILTDIGEALGSRETEKKERAKTKAKEEKEK
jgi:hypothetical protein